jgi:hypothetical protein
MKKRAILAGIIAALLAAAPVAAGHRWGWRRETSGPIQAPARAFTGRTIGHTCRSTSRG